MKIKLLYWTPDDEDKSLGHVALKIAEEKPNGDIGEVTYISCWPSKPQHPCLCSCDSSPVVFVTEQKESTRINRKEINLDDLELDATEIIRKFEELRTQLKRKQLLWALCAECDSSPQSVHCSLLVTRLLEAGGINKYVPKYEEFGSKWHILLLVASRLFVAITITTSAFYTLIPQNNYSPTGENSETALKGGFVIMCVNWPAAFLIEKYFDPDPRPLVEMNFKDFLVGSCASFGFGLYALLHRHFVSPFIYDKPLWGKVLVDLVVIPGTAFCSVLFGKIASLFLRTGYFNNPMNLVEWICYVKETKNVDEGIKNIIFKRELFFITLLYLGYIACYATLKTIQSLKLVDGYFFQHELSLYMGVLIASILTFLLGHFYFSHLNSKIEVLKQTKTLEEQSNIDSALKLHDRTLGKYILICDITLLGIIGTFSILYRYPFAHPLVESFLASVGGMVGYSGGFFLRKLYNNQNRCHYSFFSSEPRSSAGGEKQPLNASGQESASSYGGLQPRRKS